MGYGAVTGVMEWGDGMSVLEEYLDELLALGAGTICVGPTVKRATGDGWAPPWYFVIASGGPDFTDTFFCHAMGGKDQTLLDELRSLFCAKLISRHLVVHVFDDELDMARWCSRIWPGETPFKVLRTMEAERQGSVH